MVALSSIATLVHEVGIRCPGVTDDEALVRLKEAALDFCVRTSVWREVIAITSVEDQQSYTLTPAASDADIHRIEKVVPLNEDSDEMDPLETSEYWYEMSEGKLYFEEGLIPGESDDIYNVTVSLRPVWLADDANYPTWIIKRWGRGLVGKAARSILMNPPFSLKVTAQQILENQQAYDWIISDAKAEVERRGTAQAVGYSPA